MKAKARTAAPLAADADAGAAIEDVPEFETVAEARAAYEVLLRSHRQLQQIRQTEPERLLKDFVAAAERERSTFADIKRVLEAQSADASQAAKQARQESAALSAKLAAAAQEATATAARIAELQAQADKARGAAVDDLKAKLAFYEQLTGVSFSVHELPPPKKSRAGHPVCEVLVEHKGQNGLLTYKLVQRTDAQIDYAPLTKNLKPGVELPEYLSEEIEFEESQLSPFFWQILDVLCKEA